MIETVNRYVCRDCSDVALAKRNIDPAHPKDGPADAKRAQPSAASADRDAALTFGGPLAVMRAGQSEGPDLRQDHNLFRSAASSGAGLNLAV